MLILEILPELRGARSTSSLQESAETSLLIALSASKLCLCEVRNKALLGRRLLFPSYRAGEEAHPASGGAAVV